jgi:hypothetical protein
MAGAHRARRVLQLTILSLGAVAAWLATAPQGGSEALDERPEMLECATRIEGFRHATVWYDGSRRVLLEARTACAGRRSGILDLRQVTLRILDGERKLAELRADDGFLQLRSGLVRLGRSEALSAESCVRGSERLALDLASGELRMPGRRLLLREQRAFSCGSQARRPASSGTRIDAAFEGPRGRLIVAFAPGPDPGLASGNRLFFGDSGMLRQLDAETRPEGLGSAGEVSFFRGVKRFGSMSWSDRELEVSCTQGERSESYVALSRSRLAELERSIASGATRLGYLPDVLEPLFLFRTGRPGELVFVAAPVFNFHGDFRVWIQNGEKRRALEVRTDSGNWREEPPGRIALASGGGIYVPLTIDLLKTRDRSERGSPVLIRSAGAEVERLEMPRGIARSRIERFGFGKPVFGRIHTPCDPGRPVRLAPRW